MTIPKYKAKAIDSDRYFEGAYFQMPKINHGGLTSMAEEDWEKREKNNIGHYIITYRSGDWNLPNEAKMIEIDSKTLTYSEEEWKVE